ncbi:hypothetical protein [Aquimarina sp. 2201CG5-10]|uniref:hypothetical protein n=1 Tax=Aquimarina callyspongiae TaxID=3098150 RepID=UPI002AB4FD95|nr:hypothetical protein [Aquimarina sp. 2201CG5-10]MDY8137377.1 hypothetical protein [Aquimarina sp. 2201CG5-10]
MDELELLKKDWKKQEEGLPKLSYNEIYKMILKRSSSIVKWIFIISMLEFLLLAGLEIVGRINGNLYKGYEEIGLGKNFNIFLSILSFSILIFFMTRFYLNYKKIRATDSAKVLMKNILKTRRTVKYYVFINLSLLGMMLFFVFGYLVFYSPEFQELQSSSGDTVPKAVLATLLFFVAVFIVFVIGLVYYLVYGLLTRKLKRNYKELKNLEV